MTDEPVVDETTPPVAVALVVLPFPTEDAATTFAQLVQGSTQGAARPIITRGAAYEYVSEQEGRFQVIEFHGTWDGYDNPGTGAVVQRPVKEQTDG